MKLAYMMAIKNVGLKEIVPVLTPTIRGEVNISSDPISMRMHAIWAIKKVVAERSSDTYDLLWPVLANVKNPPSIRIDRRLQRAD